MNYLEAKKLVDSYGYDNLVSLGEEYCKVLGENFKAGYGLTIYLVKALQILSIPFEVVFYTKKEKVKGDILLELGGIFIRYKPPVIPH